MACSRLSATSRSSGLMSAVSARPFGGALSAPAKVAAAGLASVITRVSASTSRIGSVAESNNSRLRASAACSRSASRSLACWARSARCWTSMSARMSRPTASSPPVSSIRTARYRMGRSPPGTEWVTCRQRPGSSIPAASAASFSVSPGLTVSRQARPTQDSIASPERSLLPSTTPRMMPPLSILSSRSQAATSAATAVEAASGASPASPGGKNLPCNTEAGASIAISPFAPARPNRRATLPPAGARQRQPQPRHRRRLRRHRPAPPELDRQQKPGRRP